jgi:hypothetical protein
MRIRIQFQLLIKMLIRVKLFTLMRIRIRLIKKLWEFATTGPLILRGSILSLQASIVSVHGTPWFYFQPLKLLNFDFNADPDPH